MLNALRTSFLGTDSSGDPRPGLFGFGAVDDSPADQFASWLPYASYLEDERLFVNRDGIGFLLEIMPQSGADDRMVEVLISLDFVVFKFWHLVFPSLTLRRLLNPLISYLIRHGKDVIVHKEVGHFAALGEVDEEDFLFLFQALTQFYPPLSGLAFAEKDFDEMVFCDALPAKLRRQSMAWFDGCIRRQMLFTGRKRIVTKMNYSAMRVRTLLETYPDARIVYVVRSPLDTIPSHLSLHQNVCYHQWGKDRIPF